MVALAYAMWVHGHSMVIENKDLVTGVPRGSHMEI